MKQHAASFANFICHFGDDKVLLDYALDIVLPSFLDDKMIRGYGRTHFFFYETEVFIFENETDEPTVVVAGQFVKNTELRREQIFDPEKGIIKDDAAISSAPSAFFVLILNNHRLVYFPETAHAPDFTAFRATSEKFLKEKHRAFIDRTYEELNSQNQKVSKKRLREIHPLPRLEVIPVSGDEEIEHFVRRYEKLRKIEFRIVDPNHEFDGGEIFDEIRGFLGPMNPTDTKLTTSSNDGLDIDQALPRIKAATETANQDIKLSGLDTDGNELVGDNHSFKVSAPVDNIPPTRKGLAKKLVGVFNSLKENGIVKTGTPTQSVRDAILNIVRAVRDD